MNTKPETILEKISFILTVIGLPACSVAVLITGGQSRVSLVILVVSLVTSVLLNVLVFVLRRRENKNLVLEAKHLIDLLDEGTRSKRDWFSLFSLYAPVSHNQSLISILHTMVELRQSDQANSTSSQ